MTTHDPDKNDILPGVPASAEAPAPAQAPPPAQALTSAKAPEETPEPATSAEPEADADAGAGADNDVDNDVDPNAPYQRRIRSFVLREGRMTSAQQRAFDDHWARFGLDYTGTPRNLDETFGRSAPRVLEIGFGNGEALAWASENDLARDYIGVEVHSPGVGRVMNALAARDAHNVRVYKHDAVEVLEHEIAPGSLSEVRIWFPDPWHKKRHNKRRLVQPAFVERLASRMAPGGLLHLATDWEAYAEHMRETMEAATGWKNRVGPGAVAEKPDWRIETHFERRGTRLGHGVWDFLYEWHGA